MPISPSAVDDNLLNLISQSIDYAAGILDQEAFLEPFALIEYPNERRTLHFAYDPEQGEGLEEVLAQARDAITIGAAEMTGYAIVSVTALTIEETKEPVILIEASIRGADEGVLLAQPYQPPKGLFGFELEGGPILLGRPTNLLF